MNACNQLEGQNNRLMHVENRLATAEEGHRSIQHHREKTFKDGITEAKR